MLGSASQELLHLAGTHLGGRFGFIDLTPFYLTELLEHYSRGQLGTTTEIVEVSSMEQNTITVDPADLLKRLWLRGGFPDSYLADANRASSEWRNHYLRTQLGIKGSVSEVSPKNTY